jgi:hypothetical protein
MKSRPQLLAPLLLSLLAPAAMANLLVVDPFDDGGVTDGADPLDAAWGSNSGSLAVVSDAIIGSGNALEFTPGGTFRWTSAPIAAAPLTLGVGDSLSLSFTGRYSTDPGTGAGAFRFGFYDSNVNGNDSGYGAQIHGGSGGIVLVHDRNQAGKDGSPLAGADVLILGTGATPVSAGDSTTPAFSASFTLTRLAGGMQLDAVFNGVPFSATDPTTLFTTFDRLTIRNGNTSGAFRVDNVRVEHLVVPEPTTGALLLVGLLAVRRVRRAD